MEPFAEHIRQRADIRGVTIALTEHKLPLYAEDVIYPLRTEVLHTGVLRSHGTVPSGSRLPDQPAEIAGTQDLSSSSHAGFPGTAIPLAVV